MGGPLAGEIDRGRRSLVSDQVRHQPVAAVVERDYRKGVLGAGRLASYGRGAIGGAAQM